MNLPAIQSSDENRNLVEHTKEGSCEAVVLQIIVHQHFLTSIDAAAVQFYKVVMGYAGYDTQFIQELPCSLL